MKSLEDIISKSLRNKREKKEQKSWYASSLGSCLRGQYFQRLGIEPDKEITDRELRIFSVGNQMEDWLIGLLEGKKIETQQRLYSEKWNISGRPDLVMDGRVYEIKTKHSRAFWYMQKEGKPMHQHELQLWFYLKMLDLPEGNIVYLSKDDLSIAEFVVKKDNKQLEEEVVKELTLLNKAWENKDPSILPLPKSTEWQSKYCKYHKTHCLKV